MRQFYGRLENWFFLQEKLYVRRIPRFLGGGVFWVLGGGECRFYHNFMGARIFLIVLLPPDSAFLLGFIAKTGFPSGYG